MIKPKTCFGFKSVANLEKVVFGTSKAVFEKNVLYNLPHSILNDLRLRMLENEEALDKFQNWVEIEPIVWSSFQRQNFCISDQKINRSSFEKFLPLSNSSWFFYFLLNILCRITEFITNKKSKIIVTITHGFMTLY